MPVLNDWENFGMKDFIAYCGLDCETCAACAEMETCKTLSMITQNNAYALKNLHGN